MTHWAKPGVQCVCIKDGPWPWVEIDGGTLPQRVPMMAEVLTVETVEFDGDKVFLSFVEVPSVQWLGDYCAETVWNADCFRPLTKRPTDISIFTDMLTPAPGDLVPA